MTEFALVLPMLIVILMGSLDIGRAFHTHVAVSNAARVGIIFAQQVASPRTIGCTTCYFITVGDIVNKVKSEAQGGIDANQMQVGVCLGQSGVSCPITDMSQAVSSNEPITVSVTVPFTTITPFVHLKQVSGSVSGITFPFEPSGATPTPNATAAPTNTPTTTPSPTSTSTPTNTPVPTNTPTVGAGTPTNTPIPAPTQTAAAQQTAAAATAAPQQTSAAATAFAQQTSAAATSIALTPTSTPTPQPTPQISSVPAVTYSDSNKVAWIQWATNQPYSVNTVYVATQPNGNQSANFSGPYSSSEGPNSSIYFTSDTTLSGGGSSSSYTLLPGSKQGVTYVYYVVSSSTGGSNVYPSCAPSCSKGNYPTFTLYN